MLRKEVCWNVWTTFMSIKVKRKRILCILCVYKVTSPLCILMYIHVGIMSILRSGNMNKLKVKVYCFSVLLCRKI